MCKRKSSLLVICPSTKHFFVMNTHDITNLHTCMHTRTYTHNHAYTCTKLLPRQDNQSQTYGCDSLHPPSPSSLHAMQCLFHLLFISVPLFMSSLVGDSILWASSLDSVSTLMPFTTHSSHTQYGIRKGWFRHANPPMSSNPQNYDIRTNSNSFLTSQFFIVIGSWLPISL